ncbi:MAG: hypothetical protein C5B59_01300 [Bacteroidetes bacterium]|nr:MAG: hypothetical protein C5B59_01300 [Bacteroidota bacterium]
MTQFLYQNKELALPGIGIFTLDPAAELPDGHGKNPHTTAGIEFKQTAVRHADEKLIEFIRSNTGKIKPVAVADLESFLALGHEMLNIGKPFFLEGIGIITKNKDGGLEFAPGEYAVIKQDTHSNERSERSAGKKSVLEEAPSGPQPNPSRKFLLVIAILGGLSIIGWGGYMMYKKNAPVQPVEMTTEVSKDSVNSNPDSVRLAAIVSHDSVAKAKMVNDTHFATASDSVVYKFIILQTYNKYRALKRYNQLLSFDLKINMYNKDSSFFKLYFTFPAKPKDTVHIKDSLSRQYAHAISIEQ